MTPRALALLTAVIAAIGVVAMDRAPAAEPHIPGVQAVGSEATTQSLILGKGTLHVYDFPRDIKNVLVGDPATANVVMLSSRRAEIIGTNAGTTNIVFFDLRSVQIARFDIQVAPDVDVIRTAIRNLIPGGNVKVEAIGDAIMLTGTVSNEAQAYQACEIASHFVASGNFAGGGSPGGGGPTASAVIGGGPSNSQTTSSNNQFGSTSSTTSSSGGAGSTSCNVQKVVNAIVISGRDEVMLKVTVAEMDRTVIKQLGLNLNGSLGYGTSVVNFNNANPFPVNGALSTANAFNAEGVPSTTPNSPAGITGTFKSVTVNLQAMEQAGVVRTLAEPTLTAISGESAHFLAGGSFPEPSVSCNGTTCTPSVQQQPFGVGLNFTPCGAVGRSHQPTCGNGSLGT